MNNNEGGDDFNWNSLLNSDSFRSFQQHGMSQLPNLTNAEMSFHPGAISASSTMSQTRLIDSRFLSLTQLFFIALCIKIKHPGKNAFLQAKNQRWVQLISPCTGTSVPPSAPLLKLFLFETETRELRGETRQIYHFMIFYNYTGNRKKMS